MRRHCSVMMVCLRTYEKLRRDVVGVGLDGATAGWTGGMETGAAIGKEATKTTQNQVANTFAKTLQTVSLVPAATASRQRTH